MPNTSRRGDGLYFVGITLATCVLLVPCETSGEAGGPVEAAVQFLAAAEAHRCDEVWRSYTAGTQENIRAEVHRYERERDGLPQTETPQQRYCASEGTLKSGSARIVRQQGNEIVVAADLTVRVVSDTKLFPSYPTVTKELHLVREADAWRVERPRVVIGRPHERLVEVGPVDVFQPERFFSGLADRLEATTVVRTRRDPLAAALRDKAFWARALPSVKTILPLERKDGRERVHLLFEGVDQLVTVAASPPSKPDSDASEFAVGWDAEGGNKAPVYFRGSWRLRPYADSTRITLLLVLIAKQWPGDVTQGMFSAERMAQAVLGLEKAALGIEALP